MILIFFVLQVKLVSHILFLFCINLNRYVCPPGSSKPNAAVNGCPPGTFSNRTDLTDRSQCQQCPARYACLRGDI